MSTPKDFTINNLAQGKFEIILSNLPYDDNDFIRDMDLRKYNNFVKSITFPDSILNLETSNTHGGKVIRPIPSFNKELPEFTVTYGLDENMSNYWYLFNWIWQMRNANSMGGNKWLKDSKINEAILCAKDNNGTTRNYISFLDCYISNLSGIDFNYGNYENLRFTVTYKFNGLQIGHFGLNTGTM